VRSDFDMLLAHEAARQGAHLREGVRVDGLIRHAGRLVAVNTSAGDIEVDAAVVSNGATSTLAPASRPGTTLNSIMGWYEGVDGITDAVELYFDAVVKPYYGWLFPESDRRVNIGICYAPVRGGANARERFDTFVQTRFGPRLRHATRIARLVGHPIATTYRPAALAQQGVIVAGEAGRLVDPITAEGIHHAMVSGLLGGALLGELLEQGREPSQEWLAPYTKRVRRRLGAGLMVGQTMLSVAKTPILEMAMRFASTRSMRTLLTWALARA
jgi:flavin-dependent dehydrogenase